MRKWYPILGTLAILVACAGCPEGEQPAGNDNPPPNNDPAPDPNPQPNDPPPPEEPPNEAPIADAGPDQTLPLTLGQVTTIVQLDGSSSVDNDGSIVAHTWTGAPDPDDVPNPVVELGVGEHTFSLEVTDDDGAVSAVDTVTITILDTLLELDAVDFSDLSFFQLNGAATTVPDGNVEALRLTTGPQQAGSAFAVIPLPRLDNGDIPSFSTMFAFRATEVAQTLGPGDGLTFALAQAPNTLGAIGGGMGLGGVDPSYAIEFDMFQNPGDSSDNHVGSVIDGDFANASAFAEVPLNMASGTERFVWIDYNTGGLSSIQVRINDIPQRPTDPLVTFFGSGSLGFGAGPVYAGFTAGTGGAASTHDILEWRIEVEE